MFGSHTAYSCCASAPRKRLPLLMSEQEFLVSGKLRVFPHSEKVVLEDKELVLTGLTYRLLLALLHAEGQRLTTEQLAEQVWQQHFVSAETVSQRVSILRKALGKVNCSFSSGSK